MYMVAFGVDENSSTTWIWTRGKKMILIPTFCWSYPPVLDEAIFNCLFWCDQALMNSRCDSFLAKVFSMPLLLLDCLTYRPTALSNWKHQKLSGDENLAMSSGRWMRLCNVIKHSETSYVSSIRMQYLQHNFWKVSIISTVHPFWPQLKTNSTILGSGAQTSPCSGDSSPSRTNSEAG